jgi:hypothetical protein
MGTYGFLASVPAAIRLQPIAGLWLSASNRTSVCSVDEKLQIQMLDREHPPSDDTGCESAPKMRPYRSRPIRKIRRSRTLAKTANGGPFIMAA